MTGSVESVSSAGSGCKPQPRGPQSGLQKWTLIIKTATLRMKTHGQMNQHTIPNTESRVYYLKGASAHCVQ